jgi:hypothetical protein
MIVALDAHAKGEGATKRPSLWLAPLKLTSDWKPCAQIGGESPLCPHSDCWLTCVTEKPRGRKEEARSELGHVPKTSITGKLHLLATRLTMRLFFGNGTGHPIVQATDLTRYLPRDRSNQ